MSVKKQDKNTAKKCIPLVYFNSLEKEETRCHVSGNECPHLYFCITFKCGESYS